MSAEATASSAADPAGAPAAADTPADTSVAVAAPAASTLSDASCAVSGKEANTTLTAKAAVDIFIAKHSHTSRDALSCKLAVDYGITSKSVRDIWNMRTWGWATLPHWTEADKRRYLEDRLCPACRRRGVQTVEAACERCTVRCTVTKRRGRPPGIKETKPRKRASAAGADDLKNQMANFQHGAFMPNMPIGLPLPEGAAGANGQTMTPEQQQQHQQMMLAHQQLLQQGLGVFPPAQLPGTSGAMDTQQLLQHQQHFMQQWQWSQLIQQQQMGMNMVPPLDGQQPMPPPPGGNGQPATSQANGAQASQGQPAAPGGTTAMVSTGQPTQAVSTPPATAAQPTAAQPTTTQQSAPPPPAEQQQ